jgi:hypothetical protein
LLPCHGHAAATLAGACIAAIQRAMAALPAGPVLLNSYVVEPGAADFDLTQAIAAYVYDNALAGLALLAAGDAPGARRIGEALAVAQTNDRFWHDGRLRDGYQAGAMRAPAKLPGWWDAKASRWAEDPYQVGSQTGPIAWAMLLWLALGMRDPALRAAGFIEAQLPAATGYAGGFYGFEPAPLKLLWQSTEQNVDVAVAFRRLGRAASAANAAAFVRSMFGAGVFSAGLSPAGAKNTLLAADAGIWPFLAGLGSAASASAAIARLKRGRGIGFSAASDSVWLEGTAFAALALRRGGNPAGAAEFLDIISQQTAPDGYVYATVAPELATGLTIGPSLLAGVPEQKFNYFRRPSLSATAWTALAAMNVNPLTIS